MRDAFCPDCGRLIPPAPYFLDGRLFCYGCGWKGGLDRDAQREERIEASVEVRRLAELICDYECDMPYDDDETPPLGSWPWEKIKRCLNEVHCGDCANVPMSCARCFVENAFHKAEWIAEHLSNP